MSRFGSRIRVSTYLSDWQPPRGVALPSAVDYLVVAGGGGAGAGDVNEYGGGGGGAGG